MNIISKFVVCLFMAISVAEATPFSGPFTVKDLPGDGGFDTSTGYTWDLLHWSVQGSYTYQELNQKLKREGSKFRVATSDQVDHLILNSFGYDPLGSVSDNIDSISHFFTIFNGVGLDQNQVTQHAHYADINAGVVKTLIAEYYFSPIYYPETGIIRIPQSGFDINEAYERTGEDAPTWFLVDVPEPNTFVILCVGIFGLYQKRFSGLNPHNN